MNLHYRSKILKIIGILEYNVFEWLIMTIIPKELAKQINELEEHLNDLEEEKEFVLVKTSVHTSISTIKRYEIEINFIKEKIADLKKQLEYQENSLR